MRPFEPTDLAEVNGWLAAWGMAPLSPDLLPRAGCFVPGVAVGFLMQTDTSVGVLEFFVVNPRATKRERSAGIDAVVAGLVEVARARGCRMVWGVTGSAGLASRAPRLGFTASPNTWWIERSL